ncbi:CARDB protein, partial [Flexibacter flexilis DSM 6793]
MKKLLTFFWVLLSVQLSIAQQVVIPADNSNDFNNRRPLSGWYGYECSHMLYTSSEIGFSGNITAISFYLNSTDSPADSPVEVYFKQSSNTSISASTISDAQSGATLVWSGTITSDNFIADDWVTITLTSPFAYNNGSNLEILVKNSAGGMGVEPSGTAKQFRHSTTSDTQYQYWYDDYAESIYSGYTSSSRPNIRINFATSAPNSVGVSSVLSPKGSCNLSASTPVSIVIRNNGTAAQNNVTIPVFYSINGGAAVAGSFTGTLASGATANYTFPTNANLGTPGTYVFKFWTAMSGDASTADDTLKNYSVTKIPSANISNVDFGGYTGDNLNTVFTGWNEGSGQAKPTGNSSNWGSNPTAWTNTFYPDDTVAAVNLYTTGKKEWIYSPMFTPVSAGAISFKVALREYSNTSAVSAMGSDDSLNIRVTSDCGATWHTIYSITAANAPTVLEKTEFSFPLSAYAGQEIRIGFFATEGTNDDSEDYWLILDDINVLTLAPNNVGVTKIISPVGSCGLSASTPVIVRIKNFGTAAQSNIPVQYTINGGTPVTATYTTSLDPGAEVNFTFPTSANLSTPGTYLIEAKTLLVGDVDANNDAASGSSIKIQPYVLNSVDFGGYTGDNLGSIFPGWAEGQGQNKPTNITSGWTSNPAAWTNTFYPDDTVAAVNLYTTGKKEWIYSPLFVPTEANAISFKLALRSYSNTSVISAMGSDDSLNVKVTTDCGATWQTVYSITAANAPTALEKTEFSMPVYPYFGQEIKVGFFATEGSLDDIEDYWIILDDIQLITLFPNNTGITQIVSPVGNCGLSGNTPITVKIRNFGTSPQSNIPVQYAINGGTPVTTTYTDVLAPGATANFTFPVTVNLSTPGNYSIEAKTVLAGDMETTNDAVSSVVTKIGAGAFVSVNFNGFTGANLNTKFPGWSEATGQAKPTGTTSSWTSNPTAWTDTFYPNDTVASFYVSSFSALGNGWLVSPLYNVNTSDGLSFKLALRQSSNTSAVATMDIDDSVSVRITNDCGATWQTIYSVTAANAPTVLEKTEFVVPLTAFVGQEIQIGLFATEGTSYSNSSYYILVDDIQIEALVPNNVGITSILAPSGACG